MSKGILTSLVKGATAIVVAVTGTNIAYNEKLEDNKNNYCIVQQEICPKVQAAVDWAIEIANDPSHGYDQVSRWGPNYDCSSLIISALKNAGIATGNATYTGNMSDELTKHGFTAYKFDRSQLQYGDILLTEGHTEWFISNGELVGANANENYGKNNGKDEFKYGTSGDQTEKEIYIKPYYDYDWYCILRYIPKWYDWLDNPNLPDNFYAFIENGGSVLSSSGGTMHLESENGNEQQIWHFTKETAGRYTVSNADISGSYNLYQDDTGSIIFNASGSEMACLTASADVVQTSDYDSCSDAQHFTIRPVSDPIMVEYDFGGSSCPIIEEHYGEPYKGAFDLTWMTGFVGWFDENGNKVDASSIVTDPYAHTLTARFDPTVQPIVEEMDPETIESVTVTAPSYNAPLELESISTTTTTKATQTATAKATTKKVTTTTSTTIVPVEITAKSVSINRSAVMLNTVGKSKTYQLHTKINPENVTDSYVSWSSSDPSVAAVDAGLVVAKSDGTATITAKTKNGKTATCKVVVKTSYDKIKGEWTNFSTTPVSASNTTEVEIKNITEKVLWGYVTDSHSTRTWNKRRQYRPFSINPAEFGLDIKYGENNMNDPNMFNTYLTFSVEEFSKFKVIHPGESSTGSQNGVNMGNIDGYEYYDGYIIFIKEAIYNDVTTTYYRSRNITEIPTVYAN